MAYTPTVYNREQLNSIWVEGFSPTQFDFQDLFASLYVVKSDIVGVGTPIQQLGMQNSNFTVDFNQGRFVHVTAGSGAAIVTIPNFASSGESVNAWLYINNGVTGSSLTLNSPVASANNIVSVGGTLSAGDTIINSGPNTTDAFEFTWTGTQWVVTAALYNITT
jgi:hypothetical protein